MKNILSNNEILSLYNSLKSIRKCSKFLKEQKGMKMNKETFRLMLNKARAEEEPNAYDTLGLGGEALEYFEKLAHQKQKLQDINRIERKTWRGVARFSNAFEEVDKELIKLLEEKEVNFKCPTYKAEEGTVGIIQLSDLHLNECVKEEYNQYNWEIASKRLRKHIQESMLYFKAKNVMKVLIAMTGDITNSDKVLDKILQNATNRANALFLATLLIKSAIQELCENGFEVFVTFCIGNEARVNENIEYSNILASNNFDFMLYHCLRLLLEKTNVKFMTPNNVNEAIISIHNKNILLCHGHLGITKDVEGSVQKLMAKYQALGTHIDYVLMGHIHSAYCSDFFARSGSLTGSNAYNFYGLNIHGKASQNCLLVSNSGITAIKNDLDDVSGVVGYEYPKEIESYNTKSSEKLNKEETIIKIVI